MQDFLST